MKFIINLCCLILVIVLLSCKKSSEIDSDNNIPQKESKILHFKFQDTVINNETVSGELIYNYTIDGLKKSDIGKRYTFFYVTTDKGVLNLESIKASDHINLLIQLEMGYSILI